MERVIGKPHVPPAARNPVTAPRRIEPGGTGAGGSANVRVPLKQANNSASHWQ
jgi:hypothetical protein